MFENSTDHGNDETVAQLVFLFLSRVIFRETSTEMDFKTFNVIVKNKIYRQHFSIVCTLITVLWTIEMTSKFSKLCSETTHLRLVVPLEF